MQQNSGNKNLNVNTGTESWNEHFMLSHCTIFPSRDYWYL